VQHYADAKTTIIQEIMERANAAAERSNSSIKELIKKILFLGIFLPNMDLIYRILYAISSESAKIYGRKSASRLAMP